jgi:hypothetical protein
LDEVKDEYELNLENINDNIYSKIKSDKNFDKDELINIIREETTTKLSSILQCLESQIFYTKKN